MNKKNLMGVAICTVIFLGSFLLTGSVAAYFNIAAFLVVFSGLGAALLLSYPFERIRTAMRVAWNTYTSKPPNPDEIVHTLLDLSVRSKVDGMLSLEKMGQKTTLSFLQNGIQYLVDNYTEDEIRDCLGSEMVFFQQRRMQNERVFQSLARMAPAFGVAGSVIGLIGLLMGIGDVNIILESIPVAFVSTLYGVILANLVFAPMAENIHFHTNLELLNQKLILEGMVAIHKEQNPYKLERKLTCLLTPSQREGKTDALKSITRRYIEKRRKEEARNKVVRDVAARSEQEAVAKVS